MSFWSADELAAIDYVVIYTSQGATQIKIQSPGVATISGDGIPQNWQVREGFGISGSTQAFRGNGLAEFGIQLKLWTPEQREEFEVFDSFIAPSPEGSPAKVYVINHPILALRGITQCVFLNAPFVTVQPDDSVLINYKCRQWRKALPTLTTPTSAAGESAKGAATDQYDKLVADRTATLQNLLQAPAGGSP